MTGQFLYDTLSWTDRLVQIQYGKERRSEVDQVLAEVNKLGISESSP